MHQSCRILKINLASEIAASGPAYWPGIASSAVKLPAEQARPKKACRGVRQANGGIVGRVQLRRVLVVWHGLQAFLRALNLDLQRVVVTLFSGEGVERHGDHFFAKTKETTNSNYDS